MIKATVTWKRFWRFMDKHNFTYSMSAFMSDLYWWTNPQGYKVQFAPHEHPDYVKMWISFHI